MFVWETTLAAEQVLQAIQQQCFPDTPDGVFQVRRQADARSYYPLVRISGNTFSLRMVNRRKKNSLRKMVSGRVEATDYGCRITAKLQIHFIIRLAFLAILLTSICFIPVSVFQYAGWFSVDNEIAAILGTILFGLMVVPAGILTWRAKGAKRPKTVTDTQLLAIISHAVGKQYTVQ